MTKGTHIHNKTATRSSPAMNQKTTLTCYQKKTINRALKVLESLMDESDFCAISSDLTADYCRLKIGHRDREIFGVLFLNAQNKLIAFEELFVGTIDQASVYPREIVKRTLLLNASSVILTHNHPSGHCEPSTADKLVTFQIVKALGLIDVEVLDHIIVSVSGYLSFRAKGLMQRGYCD